MPDGYDPIEPAGVFQIGCAIIILKLTLYLSTILLRSSLTAISLIALALVLVHCRKLYSWGWGWFCMADKILKVLPQTKQQFRKPGHKLTAEEQAEWRASIDLNMYNITYDEDNFEFNIVRSTPQISIFLYCRARIPSSRR